MRRRLIVLIGVVSMLGAAHNALAGLIGYWPLDEGTGGQVFDASGKGHTGTINGATWATPGWDGRKSCLLFNGSSARVEVPHANDLRFAATAKYTLAAWVNWTTLAGHWSGVVTKGREVGNWYGIWLDTTNHWVFGHGGNNQTGSAAVANVWTHVAMVYNNGDKRIYLNGKLDNETTSSQSGDNTGDLWFGAAKGVTEFAPARIDDIVIYDQALTDVEIQDIMKGLASKALAVNVNPADATTDVPRDATLNWTAGQYPSTHDVYLGTVLADVNSASRTNPKGVLLSQGQADTTFDAPGSFAYGQTYYWRIDEVNKSADGTLYKGNVWSFTAEPYGCPVKPVTATASTSQPNMGPENTINGSGMTGDLHGTDGTTMWMSTGLGPNWIQYQFDKVYKLNDLKVWNSNQIIEAYIGFGAKNVKIEYSTDGTAWTALANVPQFARGTGLPTYTANTTVQFGGVMAQYVKLTINSSWGGLPQTGLSEVRFTYVPVQARAPQPATGATAVSISTVLNWRPGREVGSHKVFLGTDANAVANGAATAKTVTDHSFTPASLLFGTTYYWRVDEVNTVSYPGDVWRFTTQEFAAVDDFEGYNDTTNRIYDSWIDGLTDGKSGSTVGYMAAPFAETTIIHGGKQSMPLAYNNSKSPYYSETTRDLGTAQDWTGNGATHLDLWFQGYAAPTVPVTVTNGVLTLTGDGTDIWNNADDFAFAYKTLTGDGSIVARVVSVGTGTNTWAKGGVMIRGDLTAGSADVFMVLTANSDGAAGNGASFQYRLTSNGGCANTDSTVVIKPPYWAKLQRTGNLLTGYVSANGTTWTQQGTSQTISMTNPVDIGICVTAHQAGEQRTMQFDNITTTGNVTGSWQGAQINSSPHNAPAGLYVAVQDNAGKSKLSVNANPAATNVGTWTQWTIPLSDLTAAGLKTTAIKKITIGIGDRNSPAAGGAGMLFIDDIGFGHPAK